ncbi:fusion and transporter Ugo1 [Schizosaccharomyces cryophilus OY26]|uniref:Fusion and transporter Ugo1 n=1 Tax=Schizosaccharomyces cryophilus (strain OY26 / ATCC MYA-4695 / CBS 11777 / NBRC 106824 / NRRL Y48691) TaxID=653667 RepID=S9W3X0_SCHCR|nr:fusion and transporter Ugo1 [Schizosaccharomyces cryophilus OY26]EPY53229.1 fusion and transporter Ugo1 [Schizosaccharomyces cryophilus OY26]
MNPYRPYVLANNLEVSPSTVPQPDFEPEIYINSNDIFDALKSAIVTKYLTTFLIHPLEAAKTICQVEAYLSKDKSAGSISRTRTREEEDEHTKQHDLFSDVSDDEQEINAYFESPSLDNTVNEDLKEKICVEPSGYVNTSAHANTLHTFTISPSRYSIKSIISSLWEKEGAKGLWKGHTVTFLYNLLYSGFQTWLSATFSGFLSIPDPNIMPPVDSVRPLSSVFVKSISSAISALVLAPLDIARTKIILFPITSSSSLSDPTAVNSFNSPHKTSLSTLRCLKSLPPYCPSSLIFPTICYASLPTAISSLFPIAFRNFLGSSSIMDSFVGFTTSSLQFALQIPLETCLRRAQAQYQCDLPPQTIVPAGRYTGITGTVWCLLSEEDPGRFGIEGLYRGWRVGVWGITSALALNFLSSNFREEVEF